jgi:hypothetical protein
LNVGRCLQKSQKFRRVSEVSLILYFWVYILKVIEDLSYVVLLRKKFSYIESIPGVLLPHPSSSAYPCSQEAWHFQPPPAEFYEQYNYNQPLRVTPSMSSLEALLSKLPSVVPPTTPPQSQFMSSQRALEFMGMAEKVAKEEETDDHHQDDVYRPVLDVGESSTSMSAYRHHQHHFHQNQE